MKKQTKVIAGKPFKLKQSKATETKTKAYLRGWQNGFNKATQDELDRFYNWLNWFSHLADYGHISPALRRVVEKEIRFVKWKSYEEKK